MSIFSGVANALTGGLIGQVGDILDKTSTSDEERLQIQQAIEKQVQDHTAVMEDLLVEREKVSADDRASARGREIAVKDYIPGILAIFLTAGFFGLLGWMMYEAPPDGSKDILNVMLGSLGTGFITMLAYYYGSSASSAQKTTAMAQAINNNP
jgi:hypothetical protein